MAEAPSTNSALRLSGKIAIVTGGASGIGEATARVFAQQGAHMVVIADIQDELGNQVAASIGNQRCSYIHCNVADEDQVKNLVQSTVDTYGQVRNISNCIYYFLSTSKIINYKLISLVFIIRNELFFNSLNK
jgi:NAD(P)-dependent dehydrogenase (short-subunit alcohol dehydrogenase family)